MNKNLNTMDNSKTTTRTTKSQDTTTATPQGGNTKHHTQTHTPSKDYSPVTIVFPRLISSLPFSQPLNALLDSGSTLTLISRSSLPSNIKTTSLKQPLSGNTVNGSFNSTEFVILSDVSLPEFGKSRRINEVKAIVFDAPAAHDIIVGRDVLNAANIVLDFQTKECRWLDIAVPMKTRQDIETHIMDSKYEATDTQEVAQQQKHLSTEQQQALQTVLSKRTKLFSGNLGKYTGQKMHLSLQPGAVPKFLRHYPVPVSQQAAYKKELDRLQKIGVLERTGASEWAAPSFIIPKKDGRVRWISDFRYLNKHINRKVYPLPRITDILTRRSGYKFFTKLDISMQYYTFELDEPSSHLCVINTPFGNFRYLRLPMGVKQSPDFAQEAMESIFADIACCDVYLDDIGVFSNDWNEHLTHLNLVLSRLESHGFTVNPRKCEWAVKETDWLGYWLTPKGLRPWQKKIEAIKAMQQPTNLKQLRSFIGALNYYRDMWPRRAHLLAPLTELTGKKHFEWKDTHTATFQKLKDMISTDTMQHYPDPNKPFHVYTDASDYQLGAAIKQNGRPVAFYSRKLSAAQQNYSTIEKELLSLVETLKEFRVWLYGCKDLHLYTDHKNLTYDKLSSQRVIRWRMFLEEFHPTFHYVRGETNVLADALSRVPTTVTTSVASETANADPLASHFVECYLHHPNEPPCPVNHLRLRHFQQQDQRLLQLHQQFPQQYPYRSFGGVNLICFQPTPTRFKVMIPNGLLNDIVRWYHLVLNHAGSSRLFDSISSHLTHPFLRGAINRHVSTCDTCQRYKPDRQYGQLPPREAVGLPWSEVACDLIGPWNIRVGQHELSVNALTIIDTVSNLTELIRLENKTAAHVAMKFENEWLARYPRPNRCIHDNGKEFIGAPFIAMLARNGIEDVPTTVKNPQANSICERMHQTVGNCLRTNLHTNPPLNVPHAHNIIDSALASASYSLRSSVHRTLRVSPGALTVGRDMFLDIPIISDIEQIRQRRQAIIDQNTLRNNRGRRTFDYTVGQQVLIAEPPGKSKLDPKYTGPYTIQQVHVNGTVTITRAPNITERINIRRLKPYRQAGQ